MKTFKKERKPSENRRRLLAGSAAAALVPLWGRPVIESIVLPAHAQTSTDPATAIFGLSVAAPNGPLGQGAEFHVSLANGEFEITIYTDASGTDLSPGIFRVTISETGQFVQGVYSFCSLADGSETVSGDVVRMQIVSYTPGVEVVLQYESDPQTFTIPLNNSAPMVACPIPT